MADSNNDIFEEFEFKPINEGLGFHRKQKNQVNMTVTSQTLSNPTPVQQTKTDSVFKSPLPRPDENRKPKTIQIPNIEDDSISQAQVAVNEILKNLNQKRQVDFATETAKQNQLLKSSKPHLFAIFLDGMLITAAFLLSLILMLSITKVDLYMNLTHPDSSKLVYFATLVLLMGITFIYMVVNRSFLGYTPGEWAFDQCCGTEKESEDIFFIPRLAFRSLITMMTGFIVLPVLSYLFNKDVAGLISGVKLYKKPHA